MDSADLANSWGQNGKIRLCHPFTPSDVSHLKEQLNQVFESGLLSNFGQFNDHLEKRIRGLLKVRFAFTVPNATTGLQIVLSTLPRGSEVVVPSFAFPSTVHAIIHAGLKPVFVDVDRKTYNISIKDTVDRITNNTSAILAANNFGVPCAITELENIARNHGIKLFFDSATALGSKWHGVFLGAFGDAEVFSFSGTKIVTAGEGGIITTNNKELAEKLTCYRNYGYSSDRTDCLYTGFNGKLDELSAVFALWSLQHLETQIAYRKKLAEVYRNELATIEGVKFQNIDKECERNYWIFPIEIDSKEFGVDASTLIDGLKDNGIEAVRNFFPPVHKTKAYKEHNQLKLPNTEELSETVVCLPLHSKLNVEDVCRICKTLKALRTYGPATSFKVDETRREMHPDNGEIRDSQSLKTESLVKSSNVSLVLELKESAPLKPKKDESMEKQAMRLYDRFAPSYDEEFDVPHRQLYDEIAFELVLPHLERSRYRNTVLDVGGGTGRWAMRLAKRNFDVTLYDISSIMCNIAHDNVHNNGLDERIQIIQADYKQIDATNGHFDFVIAMGSLQYSSEPATVLREWSRVLRSGGGIAVLVDSKFARTSWMLTHSECKPAEVFEFLENRKKNGFRVNGAQATTHVFSPNELSGMMGSCGLEVTVSAGLLALWQGLDNGELQSRLAENFDLWKKLELKYCQEPSLTGLGRQILVVARKP